jgi:hypothetical protein
MVDLQSLVKLCNARRGIPGRQVMLADAFEGDGFVLGPDQLMVHGTRLLVEQKGAGALASSREHGGVVVQRVAPKTDQQHRQGSLGNVATRRTLGGWQRCE